VKVVLDTNVLLISIPKTSKYRLIFDGLIKGKYTLALSESILQEYVEIIGQKTTGQIAQNLSELLLSLDNVEKTSIYFRWNLIEKDPDDNKFVDCAVSAGVKYIVTNDKHFKHLKNIDFPPIEVVSADDFLLELEGIKK
jgi:putative PIN family toxin of toxin-antitoxin system